MRMFRAKKRQQQQDGRRSIRFSAALRALHRAAGAYADASTAHADRCRRALEMLARRLEGNVDFMERLFALEGKGALDFSAMSASMRDQMRR